VLGQNYARDYRIPEFNGAAFPTPGCHQVACVLRGGNIEGNNSMADLVKNSVECRGSAPIAAFFVVPVCRTVWTNGTINLCKEISPWH